MLSVIETVPAVSVFAADVLEIFQCRLHLYVLFEFRSVSTFSGHCTFCDETILSDKVDNNKAFLCVRVCIDSLSRTLSALLSPRMGSNILSRGFDSCCSR